MTKWVRDLRIEVSHAILNEEPMSHINCTNPIANQRINVTESKPLISVLAVEDQPVIQGRIRCFHRNQESVLVLRVPILQ